MFLYVWETVAGSAIAGVGLGIVGKLVHLASIITFCDCFDSAIIRLELDQ